MSSLLIIGEFHHKNRLGLVKILDHLKIKYMFGCESDIKYYDIIYSPCNAINSSLYPNKKFIFGPHFSVFPDNKLLTINNVHNNSIYIQPSDFVVSLWTSFNADKYIPIISFPFPVDTDKFTSQNKQNDNPTNIFIYFKRRHPSELNQIINFIKDVNAKNEKNEQNMNVNGNKIINYRIFDYIKRYDEEDYLNYLQKCKYGIIVDAHESQGFAIQEALSCNIPLLVWSTKTLSQEFNGYSYTYSGIEGEAKMVSVPYWDSKCGEVFYEYNELENTYNTFISKLNEQYYNPREFILETLSLESCSKRFLKLIK